MLNSPEMRFEIRFPSSFFLFSWLKQEFYSFQRYDRYHLFELIRQDPLTIELFDPSNLPGGRYHWHLATNASSAIPYDPV